MHIVLIGAPGSGKGTQASQLAQRYNVPAISTGNLIREEAAARTKAGLAAIGFIEKGDLVPDGLITEMLSDRLSRPDCANGFILDGYPRTMAQALALDEMDINIDIVISLESSDEVIEERMTGRRVCSNCGATYHIVSNPPKAEGLCDKCGGKLALRSDDRPETVRDRLRIYHERTQPLLDYYEAAGKVHRANSEGEVSETTAFVLAGLKAFDKNDNN